MKPADEREEELFEAALERQVGAEREAFLDQACAGDQTLRARLETLLEAHQTTDSFLEPLAESPGERVHLSTPLTEKPGDRIGRYKLLQQIGEGGWGVVYMAEQEEPIRRRVALKVIKLGMDTKQVVARFEAERQALAMMDHPNIAKVLDAGATEVPLSRPMGEGSGVRVGRPYFVMELVRGVKLTDYCDEQRLPTEERLNLFVQVCHAIQHAHQKGIIHRDIKPSNILVTMTDGVPVPKVIDFGIAKAIGQQLTDKTLFTAFEQFIGTPAYVSPEQATMTSLDVDTRSDIYALGVLLYELLTGHTPFEQKELIAAGLDQMRRIIREKEPARPSTRLSTLAGDEQTTVAKRRHSDPPQLLHLLRGDLDWIVMKSLEKDRTRRYETANGLAEDISRHLNNEPVIARPPGRAYRFQKLVRRNKLVFAAAAAVVGALVVGLGFSAWLFWREQAAHRQAQAQAKKSEQVALFLEDMLRSVGPSVAMGRDTTLLREILDRTAERLGRDLKDQPEIEAELRSTVARVYYVLGDYTNSERMHREALTIQRGLWGNLNTNVASSLSALAFDLSMQGEIEQAEPLFQEALNINTNLLAQGDFRVADSLFCLGFSRSNQGRHAEAERFLRQSIAMLRKLSPQHDGQLAKTLGQLSLALNYQGRPAEGESAAREALAIQTRLAQDEPLWDVGYTHVQLGIALALQHKLDEAEVVLRQAAGSYPKVVGAEHWHVVEALIPLSGVLREKGQTDEAERLARQALAISKKVAGHPDQAAHCLLILFSVLGKAGKWAEVESLSRQILEESRQLPPSKNVIFVLARSADWLRDQGKLSEAEPLYREGLDICRNVLTNDLALRQWLAGGLAGLLCSQGRLAEAESLGREILETVRHSPPSSGLIVALAKVADLLRDHGRPSEAEPLYREGLRVWSNVSTNDFELRQWVIAGLSDVLRNQGRLAEAEPLYREGLDLCRKFSPEDCERRQWLAGGLARTLRSKGQLAEAEALYREALTNAVRPWPNEPAKWQWIVHDLTDVLAVLGKAAEAEKVAMEYFRPAAEVRPADAIALRTHAQLSGRHGQWKDAAADLTKLLELDPSQAYEHLQLAAALAETGDLETYRACCRGMVARFAGTNEPTALDNTARACLLVPGTSVDLERASELADRALTSGEGSSWFISFQFCNGLAEYRQGRYASAADWMRKVIGQPANPGGSFPAWEREVAACSVLAMAQDHLNEIEEARATLAKANELVKTKLPQLGRDYLGQAWVDWLIAHILLREATALVEPEAEKKRPPPTNSQERATGTPPASEVQN